MVMKDDNWTDYDEIMNEMSEGPEETKEFHVPMSSKKSITGRVRLAIDFAGPEEMLSWLEGARAVGDLPIDAAVFSKDALDDVVSSNNTFIVRREGERPDEFRLTVKTITEEVV